MSGAPAAFFDRDGTLIRDVHYIARPEDVVLIDGVADVVRQLNHKSIPVIVVTNQSGIARGRLTVDDYERVAERMASLLLEAGARIDATYFCPHLPDAAQPCECRKPRTGMYRAAAADHGIDLGRSLYAGDRWRDIAPALELGGRGILVPRPSTPADEVERAATSREVAASLADAVSRWLSSPAPFGAPVAFARPSP
jgi:histidinol-phosphate phosphatase family protein